jgi:hypothetical protein
MSAPATIREFEAGDGSLANDPMVYLAKLWTFFLQNMFNTFPEGCGFHWRPSEEDTEVTISNEKPTLEAIEKTPHITVVIGPGQMHGLSMDQHVFTDSHTGTREHTDLASASVAFHCQARNGLMARRMAWNAGFYTNALRRMVMRQDGIHHVNPGWNMSGETPPTAYTGPLSKEELVAVVVTVSFYWQPHWTIKECVSTLLDSFAVTLSVRDRDLSVIRVNGVPLKNITLVDIDAAVPELVQQVEVE